VPNKRQQDYRHSSFLATLCASWLFPAFLSFTISLFFFLLLIDISVTESLCQSTKLCMQPLITLNRHLHIRAMPTRCMPPSAIYFLRPAPIHALPLRRPSPNLYSPPRASSWLSMRSYLFWTLNDLRSVDSLSHYQQNLFADMLTFILLSRG
jgi:hypothetical protein